MGETEEAARRKMEDLNIKTNEDKQRAEAANRDCGTDG